MKLSRIREVANKYAEVVLAEKEATIIHEQNPTKETARKLMHARSRLHTSKKTLKNYSPIFNVRLGDFASELEAVLKNNGAEDISLFSTSITENATGEFKTELFLSFTMNDHYYSENIAKIINKEPVPIEQVENLQVNLLSLGMVRGKNIARLANIQSVLDHAGWATITNTIKNKIYLQRIEKEERNKYRI